jgi:transposase-like protein
MIGFTFGTIACPSCGADRRTRLRRSAWMKLLLRSKHYRCGACYGRYLVILARPAAKPPPRGPDSDDQDPHGHGRCPGPACTAL